MGLFFIGVFKIFRFEVMFFDKIVKIDPIFSCHAELGTPLNYSISPLQANNAPMRTCVKDRWKRDDRHALGVTRTMDEGRCKDRGTTDDRCAGTMDERARHGKNRGTTTSLGRPLTLGRWKKRINMRRGSGLFFMHLLHIRSQDTGRNGPGDDGTTVTPWRD